MSAPLSDTALALIAKAARECGKFGNEAFTEHLTTAWLLNADKGLTLRLRYLYTKRDGIDELLGENWRFYDYTDADVTEKRSDVVDHLTEMRGPLVAEIALLEKRQSANNQTRVAPITTQTPNPPDLCRPNPNSRRFKGDPLRPQYPTRILP